MWRNNSALKAGGIPPCLLPKISWRVWPVSPVEIYVFKIVEHTGLVYCVCRKLPGFELHEEQFRLVHLKRISHAHEHRLTNIVPHNNYPVGFPLDSSSETCWFSFRDCMKLTYYRTHQRLYITTLRQHSDQHDRCGSLGRYSSDELLDEPSCCVISRAVDKSAWFLLQLLGGFSVPEWAVRSPDIMEDNGCVAVIEQLGRPFDIDAPTYILR